MLSTRYWLLIFALLVLSFSLMAQSSGVLDPTFNGNGKVLAKVVSAIYPSSTTFHRATSVAATSSRIYVTGSCSNSADIGVGILVLNLNGNPDATFDTDGKLQVQVTSGSDNAQDVIVQTDGKILIGGFTQDDFFVIRLNTNGTLDNSWGGNGIVKTDVTGTWERINRLALQSDGKVIAAGYSGTNVNDVTVVRYNSNGTVDTSFGTAGSLNMDLQGRDDRIEDVAIQSDGKILLTGSSSRAAGDLDGFVMRLTSSGALDNTFNTTGYTIIDFGEDEGLTGIALLPDNKIICTGAKTSGSTGLYRFNTNGIIDTSFGTNGFSLGRTNMWSTNVVLHSSGKILVFGYTTGVPNRDFATLSFNQDGVLDASFGDTGLFKSDMKAGSEDYLYKGFVQNDGKLLLAGDDSDNEFVIARVTAPEQAISFNSNYTTVTDNALTTIKGPSLGSAWADFNNDGLEDLLVVNYASYRNFIFKNLGNKTFENYGSEPIVTDVNDSSGASWGDYNNDGLLDLFVSNYSGPNFLYKNNGGSFTKITTGAVVTDITAAWDAAWVDYNNDGLLDIFVNTNNKNFLYKNLGNDQFEKITTGNIVNDNEASFASAWGDYNNDGFVDLFIANYGNQNNSLYKNKGDGTFQKIVTGSIVNDGGQSRSASWGDYNNDGFLDLYVTNSGQANFLYKNNGNETFTKITNDPIVIDNYWSYSSTWTDYNNDGYLDMAVVNSTSTDSVSLFKNNKDGTFSKIRDKSLIATNTSSWSISPADFNNDGYEDLYVAGRGFSKGYLFENANKGHNYIAVSLKGISANRFGIGARVRVKSNGFWQTKQVTSKSGRGSQGSLRLNFGVLQSSVVDSLIVLWPGNKRQILTNKSSNQLLQIEECSPYNRNEKKNICFGDSFTFGNLLLTTTGSYTHVFLSKKGCDSTVVLDLKVNPKYNQSVNATICEGSTYHLGGQVLSTKGTYTEVFRSLLGCDSVVNLTLNVITIDKTVKQEGLTLTSNELHGEYQWVSLNDISQVLATEKVFTASFSGEYEVKITKEGCKANSDMIPVIILSVDEDNKLIAGYPNPAKEAISFKLPKESRLIRVNMFNINGQPVREWNFSNSKEFNLYLHNIADGSYFFEIIADDNIIKTRVVKKE